MKRNPSPNDARFESLGAFLRFVGEAGDRLKKRESSTLDLAAKRFRSVIEEPHDDGPPYQRFESALYDGAQSFATLWPFFGGYTRDRLEMFGVMLSLELNGLATDRHPRSIWARHPIGVAGFTVGVLSVWLAAIRLVAPELFVTDPNGAASGIVPAVQGIWGVVVWLVIFGGLFAGLWYIFKTVRNRRQVARLAQLSRALEIYLKHDSSG